MTLRRRETVELVAGPHDGVRVEVTRHAPVLRMPARPEPVSPAVGMLHDREPAPPLEVHLYVRTVARSFDGVPRFLWKGLA